jgi:hypothetical protein
VVKFRAEARETKETDMCVEVAADGSLKREQLFPLPRYFYLI